MAHRMQITLDEDQYERLRREAERTGASIAELIRRAVNERYRPELTTEEKVRIAQRTAGLWSDEQAERFLSEREGSRAKRRRMLGL